MRKLRDYFIGVMHKHTYAGFKRLDKTVYEQSGYHIEADYDGYCHNVSIFSFSQDNISENTVDQIKQIISEFENNKMRFV